MSYTDVAAAITTGSGITGAVVADLYHNAVTGAELAAVARCRTVTLTDLQGIVRTD